VKIERIGKRGTLLTFQEGDSLFSQDTCVYLINTEDKLFLCDTHVGPKSMDIVKDYINAEGLGNKEIIVFNTHSDWDHIWGNCAFPDSIIIAHDSCRRIILENGEKELERYKGIYHDGSFGLKLPNLTFDSKLRFEDYGIEFIYAPGHTVDSAICYDKIDSVLFVGDLVEYPEPYLQYENLEEYIKTLECIKSIKADTVISGHSGIVNEDLINENISFIRKASIRKIHNNQ